MAKTEKPVKPSSSLETPEMLAELKELNKHLARLGNIGNKEIAFKYALGLSIAKGAGYAIGATLVAGIAVALIVQAIKSANNIPILGPALQNEVIQNNLPGVKKDE